MTENAAPTTRRATSPLLDTDSEDGPSLHRTLSLPLLVFYGLGVTVGAGIFALVGEILGVAGAQAPLAFLVAGVIAGFTGVSYMGLVAKYPRAGGEAVYVNRGVGKLAGRTAGLGVVITGVISSAVVALAFAGYVTTLVPIPKAVAALSIVALLTVVAWWGVRESVYLASAVTVLEVGTLFVVTAFGLPGVELSHVTDGFNVFADGALGPVLTGAGVAFFAFIGFEDIANMAEETVDPRRAAPRAIFWTLIITVFSYVSLAVIAASIPDRSAIVDSDAPMSVIFESVSGRGAGVIATIASFAMVNGILVQIVMAARVLYGMASDNQLPSWFGAVDTVRQTPTRATVVVGAAISVLLLFFPLLTLARATSMVTLAVFTLVNIALVRLAGRDGELGHRGWVLNGCLGAVASAGLMLWQVVDLF